jgi:hypothetical protein
MSLFLCLLNIFLIFDKKGWRVCPHSDLCLCNGGLELEFCTSRLEVKEICGIEVLGVFMCFWNNGLNRASDFCEAGLSFQVDEKRSSAAPALDQALLERPSFSHVSFLGRAGPSDLEFFMKKGLKKFYNSGACMPWRDYFFLSRSMNLAISQRRTFWPGWAFSCFCSFSPTRSTSSGYYDFLGPLFWLTFDWEVKKHSNLIFC